MKPHEATEQAYKNGYKKGYADAKNEIAPLCLNEDAFNQAIQEKELEGLRAFEDFLKRRGLL